MLKNVVLIKLLTICLIWIIQCIRVLNGQGNYSPLKHTVSVSPFETVEIEFEANEEKDWIFHCHNLYHMKLGMGGVLHCDGTERDH